MSGNLIVVKAAFDAEAGVWFVEASDVPGLNAEAETLETLVDLIPAMLGDLIQSAPAVEAQMAVSGEYSIEVIAHATTRLSLSAAA